MNCEHGIPREFCTALHAGDPAKLVAELRKHPMFWLNGAAWITGTQPEPICTQAADAIERLSAELNAAKVHLSWANDYRLEANQMKAERDRLEAANMSLQKFAHKEIGRLRAALALLIKDRDRGMESSEATWDYAREALVGAGEKP